MVTFLSRPLPTGKTFTVEVEETATGRTAVARVDGQEIGRGAGQVGWALSPANVRGTSTHAAGKVGGLLVGMTADEARRLGKVLYAREIAETKAERRFDARNNEGGEGFNPHR